MSFKTWLLQKEKEPGVVRSAFIFRQLIKKNPDKHVQLFFSALIYFIRLFLWRLSLLVIHLLNYIRETALLLALRKQCCKLIPSFHRYYYDVQMPVNLQAEHKKIFANNFYLLKPLRVMQLRNYRLYITSYFGIVFKGFSIVRESIHGRWSSTRKKVLKDYYQQVMETWFISRYDNRSNIVELNDDKEYLLVHHWFNYYHWFTETLVRLWVVKDRVNNYTLLLPESFQQMSFVAQSLAAMGVRNVRWIKEGAIVLPRKLTLVENKPYNSHYDPRQMKEIGQHFRNHAAPFKEDAIDLGERIFITRKKAVRRKMVNEAEIEDLLVKNGFQIVALEEYNLLQEINIMSKAKCLIGMHGAGLTNMLFMPSGGKVLELHLELSDANDMHSDVYWKLASALGHSYYYQFCKPADAAQNFFEADYLINKRMFEENLKKFVS